MGKIQKLRHVNLLQIYKLLWSLWTIHQWCVIFHSNFNFHVTSFKVRRIHQSESRKKFPPNVTLWAHAPKFKKLFVFLQTSPSHFRAFLLFERIKFHKKKNCVTVFEQKVQVSNVQNLRFDFVLNFLLRFPSMWFMVRRSTGTCYFFFAALVSLPAHSNDICYKLINHRDRHHDINRAVDVFALLVARWSEIFSFMNVTVVIVRRGGRKSAVWGCWQGSFFLHRTRSLSQIGAS